MAPEPTTGAIPAQVAQEVVLGGGVHSNLVSACWDEGAKLIGHQEMLQDESALSKIHTHTCHSLKQQS